MLFSGVSKKTSSKNIGSLTVDFAAKPAVLNVAKVGVAFVTIVSKEAERMFRSGVVNQGWKGAPTHSEILVEKV